jgi:hypothetical protein
LTPHNSIKASGASATRIGRMFSIARENNGTAVVCQLSAASLKLRHSSRERGLALRLSSCLLKKSNFGRRADGWQ